MRFLLNPIIIFTIYLYLLKPRLKRKSVKEFIGVKFAHRGLHNENVPENTLEAFSRAIEDGVGIELDINLTKDGEVIVFHDDNLIRSCNINRKISELTYDQLKEIMIFDSDCRIPTLKEVLEIVDGKVPLLIEIKPCNNLLSLKICRKTAQILDTYQGSYCIESFNPLYLWWFRYNRSHISRGQLLSKFSYSESKKYIILIFILRTMLLNVLSRPDFVSYDYQHKRLLSVILCRIIYRTPLFAWTVPNELIESDSLKKYHSFIYEE